MKEYYERKRKELESIIQSVKKDSKQHFNEHLRITTIKNRSEFVVVAKDAKTGARVERFLKRSELTTARDLAQRDYEVKVLKTAEQQLKLVERMLKKYDERAVLNIYDSMHPERQKLIIPVTPSDEEFVKRWEAVEYQNTLGYAYSGITTEKGEEVRSKSEKMIADKYYWQGIPYRYECPRTLRDGERIIPVHTDFTVLNVRTRKEYCHEHFGMMDDPEYAAKAVRKIELYEKNGYFLGETLLATFETGQKPFDTDQLDRLIRHYLL